jgi:hypothetical protein
MNTDYYLYDKANDSLYTFNNGDIVFFADKNEAQEDCRGNEIVVQFKDLPDHKKLEVNKQTKFLTNGEFGKFYCAYCDKPIPTTTTPENFFEDLEGV